MNEKFIITCGCSWTYAMGVEDSYGKLLSSVLKSNYLNLAIPGASNYFISKQIEYAATLNPNLVIIGATSELRFEFSDGLNNVNNRKITLDNFETMQDQKTPDVIPTNKIISRTSKWYNEHQTDLHFNENQREQFKEIYNFLVKYLDNNIKIDQDRLMLLGAIQILKNKKIPYIIIDFCNIFKESDTKVINLHWRRLAKTFPLEDKNDTFHFNQNGQYYIMNQLLDYKIIKEVFNRT